MKLVPKVFLVTHSETDDKGPVRVLLVRRRIPKLLPKEKKIHLSSTFYNSPRPINLITIISVAS